MPEVEELRQKLAEQTSEHEQQVARRGAEHEQQLAQLRTEVDRLRGELEATALILRHHTVQSPYTIDITLANGA